MNKLTLYIVAGMMLASTVVGIYYGWRKSIEREALLEYNQKQLEQNIRDQEDFRKKMQDIQKQQEMILSNNSAEKKIFNDKIKSTSDFLDTKETRETGLVRTRSLTRSSFGLIVAVFLHTNQRYTRVGIIDSQRSLAIGSRRLG